MGPKQLGFVVIAGLMAILAAALIGQAVVADDTGGFSQVIIQRPVERRTLKDVLTIRGELRREELQAINSAIDGKVSSVAVEDGQTVGAGDVLFALDGRAAVAVNGSFSFFRPLDVGSDGPDVQQLEEILSAAGYGVGRVDSLFTEDTRRGLARWQIDRGYGGATPEPDETITVSLGSNSAGYTLGKRNTAAFTIGPSVPTVRASGAHDATRFSIGPKDSHLPTLTITASPERVDEGQTSIVTIASDPAPDTDLTVDLTIGGDATGGPADDEDSDYVEFDTPITFPAGATTFDIAVDTLVDQVVESAEDITIALTDQFGNDPNYKVGPVNQATIRINANGDDLVPELTVSVDNDVIGENGAATITIDSTVESNEDIDLFYLLGGSAVNGTDYQELEGDVTLPAGSTSTTVTIQARADDRVEGDETVLFALEPRDHYVLGPQNAVEIKIESSDVPEMTLRGGGTIAEGGSGTFIIVASQPVVEDTSVNYSVSGSATPGIDYRALSGTVVMPAGASQVQVAIRTLDDDVIFQPSDMIVANWPARIGTVDVDEGEFVLQGSQVLSLTEPDFAITLGVSPSDRAELQLGQRVTVNLEAGDQEVDGVLTSLDDVATVDGAGNEIYEGEVEAEGDLEAVDGAAVTIEVTLTERTDVLAVPVAAVLQEAGERVVRIINDGGTISRIVVEIGLVDDEFVEIVSGLEGDEIVVVSVDAPEGS